MPTRSDCSLRRLGIIIIIVPDMIHLLYGYDYRDPLQLVQNYY